MKANWPVQCVSQQLTCLFSIHSPVLPLAAKATLIWATLKCNRAVGHFRCMHQIISIHEQRLKFVLSVVENTLRMEPRRRCEHRVGHSDFNWAQKLFLSGFALYTSGALVFQCRISANDFARLPRRICWNARQAHSSNWNKN